MTPQNHTLSRNPAPADATADTKSYQAKSWIAQHMYRVAHESKSALFAVMLRQSEMRSVLVFVQRKVDASQLARTVARSGVTAASLHSDSSQEERTAAIDAFRSGDCAVLVATDVAGRRLVVPRISHVINFDVPPCSADYLTRVGRLARGGPTGAAITFVAPDEELRLVRILTEIGVAVPSAETSIDRVSRSSLTRRRRARRHARKHARGTPVAAQRPTTLSAPRPLGLSAPIDSYGGRSIR